MRLNITMVVAILEKLQRAAVPAIRETGVSQHHAPPEIPRISRHYGIEWFKGPSIGPQL